MSLVFNMVGAGGGSAELPAIYATYPEGSVCTCSNGSKTYTAKDTSGYWLFTGLALGTWTVTITDGAKTAREDVEITTEGQSVSIELWYELWLYNKGEEYTDVTGGWTGSAWVSDWPSKGSMIKNDDYISLSTNATSIAAFPASKIDLTRYNTLDVNIIKTTTGSNRFFIGVAEEMNTNTRNNAVVLVDIGGSDSTTGLKVADISGLQGEYYVFVGLYSVNNVSYDIRFDSVALRTWGE